MLPCLNRAGGFEGKSIQDMLECPRNKSFEILACISDKPDTYESFKKALRWEVGDLKKYVVIHSGDRPFNCIQCNQAFKTSSELKRHILIHRGKKPNVCDLCNYSSANASNLKTHKLMHSGGKPFACDQCEYSTTRRHHLKTRKLMHSGKKPFVCRQNALYDRNNKSCHI